MVGRERTIKGRQPAEHELVLDDDREPASEAGADDEYECAGLA